MPGIFELIIIFGVSWWLVLLPILGAGTQSQDESGDIVQGTDAGAPVEHMVPRKMMWATIGAGVITVFAAIIITIAR